MNATQTAVAKKDDKANLPAVNYEQFAGQGFEGAGRQDFAIPFLAILQGQSPQLGTVDGAKPGLLINSVTQELFPKEGVTFVPVLRQNVFVEWKPRDDGGGFVGTHEITSELVKKCISSQEFGEYKTPAGNDLVETFYVYGIVINADGSTQQAVIGFSSTKIRKYKAWMTKAVNVTGKKADGSRFGYPLFAHKYLLTTVKEKNNYGEYWNFDVPAFVGGTAEAARIAPNDPLFDEAVNFHAAVTQGRAKAAFDTQQASGKEEPAPF